MSSIEELVGFVFEGFTLLAYKKRQMNSVLMVIAEESASVCVCSALHGI